MIPRKLDQEQDDEDCVPFQPPDSVADFHSNIIVVLLPVHNGAVVLNLVHAPRRPNLLEGGASRGEAVQQFVAIATTYCQRHLGSRPVDGSGGAWGTLLGGALAESPNDRSERVEGGLPLGPGEGPGGAARVMHALGERLPAAGTAQVERRRLHLNANLISTAVHDRLSARFHSKAFGCTCAFVHVCVFVCVYVYMCEIQNIIDIHA